MQSGNKILLVEDDKYIALALKIRLQAEGYEVSVVYDLAAATEMVALHQPDIALIDFNLPDGSGMDLIRQFSENSTTSSINAIMMTASKQTGLREQALALGAFGYFEKPFKSSDLIEAIKAASTPRQRAVA